MLDGIGDHEAAAVPVGGVVEIPVLNGLQPVAVTRRSADMDIVDMAVGMAGDGIEQGDRRDAAWSMIVAVAEGRQFYEARIAPRLVPNFCVKIEWETRTFLNLFRLSAMQAPMSPGEVMVEVAT